MSEMQAKAAQTVHAPPITVAEYRRMGEAGIIGPDERVELLDGRLIPMPPLGPEHSYSVLVLDRHFQRMLGDRALVNPQGAVTLDEFSEPQPDIILMALPGERYRTAHPAPEDALLVIEVSKSTLAFDRGQKLRSYARCGVREYWIVDLVHERIDVYRNPHGERYALHRAAHRGETIAPAAFPDAAIPVDDVLPLPPR